ncbi:hypothetical protein BVRB_003130 [Beta vulgaris subsp. vulgaris]|uniref:Uncharacterized protein n=1 Tax=Beta vulgaris subsp. vulgaris TaxID=3555 RepID=A0A0J8B875_BETVV|nr:hypothetical protein BVRB_003130 [Beta vulgaris subsp. vulgaris]
MEACKFTTFVVAVVMISSLFATFAAAQDATSIAPTPAMQSDGVTLQLSGLVAVIASLAAWAF